MTVLRAMREGSVRFRRTDWFGWFVIVVAALSLAGTAFLFFNPIVGRLLQSFAPGVLIGLGIVEIGWKTRDRRMMKMIGPMPASIQMHHEDDGSKMLIVERINGDVTTVHAPADYDPREDNGRWLIEQIVDPEHVEWFYEKVGATARFFPPPDDDDIL